MCMTQAAGPRQGSAEKTSVHRRQACQDMPTYIRASQDVPESQRIRGAGVTPALGWVSQGALCFSASVSTPEEPSSADPRKARCPAKAWPGGLEAHTCSDQMSPRGSLCPGGFIGGSEPRREVRAWEQLHASCGPAAGASSMEGWEGTL